LEHSLGVAAPKPIAPAINPLWNPSRIAIVAGSKGALLAVFGAF
jgi:hypothetical protein